MRDDAERTVGGKYLLTKQIGSGASGTQVWRAQDPHGATVAIKILPIPSDLDLRREHEGYLADEIQCGRDLNGMRHIRTFLDDGVDTNAQLSVGGPDGIWYLVFEYVEYGTLRTLLAGRCVTAQEFRGLARALCAGLAHAHTHPKRFVHRDIKPENILLPNGDCALAKIADFGIARARDGTRLTTLGDGQGVGTPRYMAPEQFDDSSSVTASADLYSVGVVLHECATRNVPLVGRTRQAIRDIRKSGLAPPALLLGGLRAPLLSQSLATALSAVPSARPSRASAMFQEIDRAGIGDGFWGIPATASLTAALEAAGLTVIDKRPKGGALWVLGDLSIGTLLEEVGLSGVRFSYRQEGGRATGGAPAWWTAATD